MKYLPVAMATPLLIAAAPSAEQPTDLRCFFVLSGAMGAAAEDRDKRHSDAIGIASMYYLGRLDGQSPRLNLEEAMASEAMRPWHQTNGQIADACIDIYRRRLKQVIDVSARLEKRGI